MKNAILILACVLMPALSSAQVGQGDGAGIGQGSGSGSGTGSGGQATTSSSSSSSSTTTQKDVTKATTAVAAKIEESQYRFVRTLTNVQVELTLTDQLGSAPPEKKTVSMIVASGNWGKIRSVGTVRPAGEPPFGVDLNVDARPLVSIDGPIQLELTLNYSPPADKDSVRPRPTGINQSQTVVLQSGKPLTISQAADPLNDRKVIVEVKATVLK